MKVSHKDLDFLAHFFLRVRYGVQDGSPFQAPASLPSSPALTDGGSHPAWPAQPPGLGAQYPLGHRDGLLQAKGTELARDMALLPSFCLEHTWKIRGSAASAKLGAGVFIMLRTRAPESDKH